MQSSHNPTSDAFKKNRDARQTLEPTVMGDLPWAECWDLRRNYREGERPHGLRNIQQDSPVAELKQSKEQTEVAEPETTETTDWPG